jgi:hypothetical protein
MLRTKNVNDNMNYKEDKERVRLAALSDKMTIPQINAYVSAYQSGQPVKDLLKGLTKEEILELEAIAKKRSD